MTNVENLYDAVIIGGGPAGLTAAIYLGRACRRVLVVEKDRLGGQIATTANVVNYPGVLAASGAELANTMAKQAANFGAEFLAAEVTGLSMDSDVKTVHTSAGDVICLSVLLATGAAPRKIGFGGENDFEGRGVSYCATCDGALFAGKEVIVIGGGYQAAEEAVFLTKYAKKVTVMMRKGDFSCAASVAKAAWDNPKIEVLPNTRVTRITGDTAVRAAVIEDTVTKGRETWRPENEDEPFGVFVLAGRKPATGLVRGVAQLDDDDCVIVNEKQETTCPGLFAAGDVCPKNLRQVATAVGQAAATATEMEGFIAQARRKTGLAPQAKPAASPGEITEMLNASASAAAVRTEGAANAAGEKPLITPDMTEQAKATLAGMAQPLLLRVSLNDLPVSENVRRFMDEFAQLDSDGKIKVEYADQPGSSNNQADSSAPAAAASSEVAPDLPEIKICFANGEWSRISFHEVPIEHEFTPFLSALSNIAGPGDAISDEARAAIARIDRPLDVKIAAGLDCPRCYKTIIPAIQATCLNGNLRLNVYDIAHFPALQRKHNIMSAPFTILNDGEVLKPGGSISTMDDLLETLRPYMSD